MTGDFFRRLELELSSFTREGAHLGDTASGRRRAVTLLRRGLTIVALAIALAASLDSEFPATANGYTQLAVVAAPQNA